MGLAICHDLCYPQMHAAYREKGVELMLHSFYNARSLGPNCLDVLNTRQVPTRCADNTMWAMANNSITPVFQMGFFCGPSRRNDCSTAAKESSRYARS